MTATKIIAQAAGIAPRTKKFVITDEFGEIADFWINAHAKEL